MNWKRLICWVGLYLLVIVVFSFLYLLLPDSEWGGNEKMTRFTDAFYFSVVTITSLGFGDIYPVAGSFSRLLVSAEAILGILVIGFFLNDIAHNQAVLMDKQNKDAEEKKRFKKAYDNLNTYKQILSPMLERYLCGVYMMLTTMEDKFKMPQDIFGFDFSFQFKDISNLYEQTILMSSDFYVPAVNAHFKNQDIAYNELRYFVTHADLGYWPELRKRIYDFIQNHQRFQYQDLIVNNGLRKMGDGKLMKDYIAEQIAKMDVMPKFESGNMFSPYVALFLHTKNNVEIVKDIYGMMTKALET